MKITFFFFFSTAVWWRMMAHTVILALEYGWMCLRGFIRVRSGWRAWWDVMVRLSEVPIIHHGARTSALSLHWNKYFPLSLLFLNWNQGWAVSPLPSIAFTNTYQPLPDLEANHCPAWEKIRSFTREGVSSLGVGRRKESLGSKSSEKTILKCLLSFTPCSAYAGGALWRVIFCEKSLKSPWTGGALPWMQGGAQLLAGCGEAELPLSEQVFSSHLIIITCCSCFSLKHDLLQPLNSNANFLQMFLAKLCMNLLKQFPESRQTLCSYFRRHFLAWRPQI